MGAPSNTCCGHWSSIGFAHAALAINNADMIVIIRSMEVFICCYLDLRFFLFLRGFLV